jgi:hypothetical protein
MEIIALINTLKIIIIRDLMTQKYEIFTAKMGFNQCQSGWNTLASGANDD